MNGGPGGCGRKETGRLRKERKEKRERRGIRPRAKMDSGIELIFYSKAEIDLNLI